MRFLFLTPQYPYPPHKGTTLRNYHVIAGLAARHTIDLLSFSDAPPSPSPLDRLCRRIATVRSRPRSNYRRAIDTLLSPWPDMGLRLWSMDYARQLQAWLADGEYDVIQIEGIELARYGLTLTHALARSLSRSRTAANRRGSTLVVFDDHNAEYLLQQRIAQIELEAQGWNAGALYSSLQARKLRGFERRICCCADRVVAVSDADADAIWQLDPSLKVQVVPNGVDTIFNQRESVEPIDLPPHALVFTGTMDFRPNVDAVLWFAREVLPLVRWTIPDAHFVIVGQRPHARLNGLRAEPSITITGAVEDTRPYIAAAAAYVIPLRMGGGTRLKLLEAMSMAAPIVSTTLGAEGFPIEHGRELLLADNPGSFARSIVDLIQYPERGQALGRVARSFVVERYDWQQIVPKFEEVYQS